MGATDGLEGKVQPLLNLNAAALRREGMAINLETPVASLTIHNIDEGLMDQLQARATQHGHSMQDEARLILQTAVAGVGGVGLWALSRRLFADGEGIDLGVLPRAEDRNAPDFEETDRCD